MSHDERKEAPKPKEPLLIGWDKALFIAGVICLSFGFLVLVAMLSTIYGDFIGDFLTFDGALEAVGASLGAAATTFAAIGSALLFVVSLRVQARELRHSIAELKSSVEAQKDAAESHRTSLALAKQEKEFNVCLQAVQRVETEWRAFSIRPYSGSAAIAVVIRRWSEKLESKNLIESGHSGSSPFAELRNVEDVFAGFRELNQLNRQMYWTLHSIEAKELDPDDRRYLSSQIVSIIEHVAKAQVGLSAVIERIDELLQLPDSDLDNLYIHREILVAYQSHIHALTNHNRKK